jgi:hypothetical protein
MEKHKTATQKAQDTPALDHAMWVIGGFILVLAIIVFFLSTHL